MIAPMFARRMMIVASAALVLLAAAFPAFPLAAAAPEEILLWPGTPPGNGAVTGPEKLGEAGAGYGAVSNIATPRMRVFRPAVPNGAVRMEPTFTISGLAAAWGSILGAGAAI